MTVKEKIIFKITDNYTPLNVNHSRVTPNWRLHTYPCVELLLLLYLSYHLENKYEILMPFTRSLNSLHQGASTHHMHFTRTMLISSFSENRVHCDLPDISIQGQLIYNKPVSVVVKHDIQLASHAISIEYFTWSLLPYLRFSFLLPLYLEGDKTTTHHCQFSNTIWPVLRLLCNQANDTSKRRH